MRVTFLTEGPDVPAAAAHKSQIARRLPSGTRVVQLNGLLGLLVAHDDYPPMRIDVDGSVSEAPMANARRLIETRANSMETDVLTFGIKQEE